MPGGFPIGGDLSAPFQLEYSDDFYSLWSGTDSEKGPWYNLGTVPFDASFIEIYILQFLLNDTGAFDIGIGPSGSEITIINNLLISSAAATGHISVCLPFKIKAGTQINVRAAWQWEGSDSPPSIVINCWRAAIADQHGYCGIDSLGFDPTITTGTTISDTGFTEIVSATKRPYHGFFVAYDFGAGFYEFTGVILAFGPSGNELVSTFLLPIQARQGDSPEPSHSLFIPKKIPVGTRISATCFNPEGLGLTVYGVY